MAIFRYVVLTEEGQQIKGELEAESQQSAQRQLLSQGHYVVHLASAEAIFDLKNFSLKNIHWHDILNMQIGPESVPFAELVAFTRQFATLIDAGIPIIQALDALEQQTEQATLKRIIRKVRADVNEGQTLATALARHKRVFNTLYINMITAAETSGTLGTVMNELATLMEERQAMVAQLKSAFTYPVFMLVVGLGVVWFLLTNVVPNITSMFADTGHALPQATQILLDISAFLQEFGLLLLVALGGVIFGLKTTISKVRKAELIWHRILLNAPIYGLIAKKVAYTRFSGTLSALLNAGVPIISALQNTAQITPYLPFQDAVTDVTKKVKEGAPLGESLRDSGVFPPMLFNMVMIGEKSGRVEQMLARAAQTYQTELKAILGSLTSLVQPILLLVMGGLIAFIMVAVLLPVFELNTIAGGL